MAVRRSANFGTYFFVGFIGFLIGSVIGRTLIALIQSPLITRIINLDGYAGKAYLHAGYVFNFNLLAILGIFLAIYIYRRI